MALRKVKVKMPKAAHGGFLKKLPTAAFGNQGPVTNQATGNMIYPIYKPNMMAIPQAQDRTTLGPVNREDSNLEAEKGETAYIPDVQGLSAHYTIGGKRHSQGGTPLNLPDDSFIFSDTSKMKIRDPKIKALFGKTTSKGITPADIAKQYDINEFRKTLADPTITDPIQIKTAEQMIANYNLKLGKLALVQESQKGMPQGIPAVALPYLAHIAVDPSQVIPLKAPNQGQPQQPQSSPTQGRYGMFMENGGQPAPFPYSYHGGPQDWANGGNALMQEGGVPEHHWYDSVISAANAPLKALTYAGESLPYGIDYLEGHGNRLKPKYEFPSDYYDRVQNAMDPTHTHTPELSPTTKAIGNIASDPLTWLGVTGTAKGVGQIAAPIAKGVAGLAGMTYEQVANLMSKLKAKNPIELAKMLAKGTETVAGRVIPGIAKFTGQSNQPNYIQSPSQEPQEYNPLMYHPTQEPIHESSNQPLDIRKYSDAQLDSIIGTKSKAYGGAIMQGGGDPIAAAIAEKKRRAALQQRPTSSKSLPQGQSLSRLKTYDPKNDPEYIKNLYKQYNIVEDPYINQETIGQQSLSKSGKGYGEKVSLDQWKNNNPWYFQQRQREGLPEFDPNNKEDVTHFEKSLYKQNYNTLTAKGLSPEAADIIAKRTSFTSDSNDIRNADQKMGDYHKSRMAIQFKDQPQTLIAKYDQEQKPLDTSYDPQGVHPNQNAPWFLQDVVKTAGAASDYLGLKKRLPWAPVVNPYVPIPTFYDPNRELAENAEQTNMAVQGAGAFGDPRQYAAASSFENAQAAKRAADIIGKYNNMNVGEANRFAGMQADIMNKTNETNAGIATSLYDKTTAANDNFDNAKAMAKQNLRQSYIDAVTNRAKAQTLNTMYPNYQIDPTTGGMLDFYKGSKINPGYPGDSNPRLQAFIKDVHENPQIDQNIIAKFHGIQQMNKNDNEYLPQGYPGQNTNPYS